MRGAIPSLAQYFFMAWCLVKETKNLTVVIVTAPFGDRISLKTRA
jgi:hypothetical protein